MNKPTEWITFNHTLCVHLACIFSVTFTDESFVLLLHHLKAISQNYDCTISATSSTVRKFDQHLSYQKTKKMPKGKHHKRLAFTLEKKTCFPMDNCVSLSHATGFHCISDYSSQKYHTFAQNIVLPSTLLFYLLERTHISQKLKQYHLQSQHTNQTSTISSFHGQVHINIDIITT